MRMRSLLWVATAAAAANTTLPRRLARSSHHGEVLAASLHAKHADADEIAARYSLLSGPRQKALDTCARGRKAARDAMVEIARTYGSETKEYKELWEAARKSVVQARETEPAPLSIRFSQARRNARALSSHGRACRSTRRRRASCARSSCSRSRARARSKS